MTPELLGSGAAVLLIVTGWPLAARRVPANRWYGLRVPATFADPQVWYDANAIAGRDLMALGALLLLVSLALPRLGGLAPPMRAGTYAALLGLGSLVLTVRGWRAANRLRPRPSHCRLRCCAIPISRAGPTRKRSRCSAPPTIW